jgi:hypothetical protein
MLQASVYSTNYRCCTAFQKTILIYAMKHKHTLGPKPALALPALAGVSAEPAAADVALALLLRAGVTAALSPAALRLLGVLMLLLLPPGITSALLAVFRLVGVGGCAPAAITILRQHIKII